jgi:hypothetical protein
MPPTPDSLVHIAGQTQQMFEVLWTDLSTISVLSPTFTDRRAHKTYTVG